MIVIEEIVSAVKSDQRSHAPEVTDFYFSCFFFGGGGGVRFIWSSVKIQSKENQE